MTRTEHAAEKLCRHLRINVGFVVVHVGCMVSTRWRGARGMELARCVRPAPICRFLSGGHAVSLEPRINDYSKRVFERFMCGGSDGARRHVASFIVKMDFLTYVRVRIQSDFSIVFHGNFFIRFTRIRKRWSMRFPWFGSCSSGIGIAFLPKNNG